MQPPDLKPSLGNFFKYDAPAGIVVFLVAVPLCLGIALASGAPLFAGIIAGVVGGVVVSLLSGSHVSVTGPAAGLTVLVAAGIQELGYQAFLTAVILAGAIQLVLGVARAGFIADYVPNSVIKGMLAGIGLVIILKQIPHALGRDKDYEGDFTFLQATGSNTFSEIVASILSASPGAVLISGLGLLVLFLWEKRAAKGSRFFTLLPGPLVAVVLGIALNQVLGVIAPSLKMTEAEHLVSLPVTQSVADFLKQFTRPDFAAIANQRVWVVGATLAIVASLETLLSVEAADRLDRYRRISPPNRELFAQGIGNSLSGLLGGLPMTSVVVRTTANIYAGARTRMSSFFHGVLLCLATLLAPQVLNLMPLASLAAVLLAVGYKLTNLDLLRRMYALGPNQFLPFISTVVAILFTGLLEGVMIGLAIGLYFVIRANQRDAITVVSQDNLFLMRFNKDATFVNKSEFRQKLRQLPENSTVVIDGARSLYIDRDIQEVVDDFQRMAIYKNISIELKHFDKPSRVRA